MKLRLGWTTGALVFAACAGSFDQPTTGVDVDKAVSEWLRLWGEDVGYSISYDKDHVACKALLLLGPAAVPALVERLGQSTNETSVDWWKRDNAGFLLDRLGPQAQPAVKDLRRLLLLPNSDVQAWSAQILGAIGPDAASAVPELIHCLHDKSRVSGEAVMALGRIRADPEHVIPEIARLLKDPDPEIQRRALVSLGRFGPEAAVQAQDLELFLDSADRGLRETAGLALSQIDPTQKQFVRDKLSTAEHADQIRNEAAFRHDPGMFCRAVPVTNRVEEGMPLQVELSAWAVPSQLPAGVKHFNAFRIEHNLILHLTNRSAGTALALDIEERSTPAFIQDEGRQAEPLDGRTLGPWAVEFRLVRLRGKLETGTYECSVELAYPATKPRDWRASAPDWKSYRFWSGRISSNPFVITVVPGVPKMHKVVVHGPPHLQRNRNGSYSLVFKKREFVTLELEVRNGFSVGEDVQFPDGSRTLQSGLPETTPQDVVLEIPERVKWPKYEATIFETVNPPGHFWQPYQDGVGYKVLWQSRFKTNLLSRSQYPSPAPE